MACRRWTSWAAKLAAEGGKPIMAFFEMIKAEIKAHEDDTALKADFLEPLKAASKDLQAAGMYFMQQGMKDHERGAVGLL